MTLYYNIYALVKYMNGRNDSNAFCYVENNSNSNYIVNGHYDDSDNQSSSGNSSFDFWEVLNVIIHTFV